MKKILLLIIFNSSLEAQIGINKTNPTALVDIETSIDKTPLNIKSKNQELKMEVNSNGDLFFKNSLLIEDTNSQNPGKPGDVLVSNGPNKKPSWLALDNTIIGNYLTSIVNANYNLIGPITYTKNANVNYQDAIKMLIEKVLERI